MVWVQVVKVSFGGGQELSHLSEGEHLEDVQEASVFA